MTHDARSAPGSTWAEDEATPAHSPSPSAAVSRTPTLVDLPAHGLAATLAEDAKAKEDGAAGGDDEAHLTLAKARHHHDHHLPHPHRHLPPHPHQHLEQYYPTNYETTDQVAQEKEEAQRAVAEGRGGDVEKADGAAAAAASPGDDYPDGGLEAWLCVPDISCSRRRGPRR